ncbi:MAG: hypothetical protein MZV49_05945 [Rhodopseudomonas palustris]|nr:hypothetical protein [Rhodopseudomonas palustris]
MTHGLAGFSFHGCGTAPANYLVEGTIEANRTQAARSAARAELAELDPLVGRRGRTSPQRTDARKHGDRRLCRLVRAQLLFPQRRDVGRFQQD